MRIIAFAENSLSDGEGGSECGARAIGILGIPQSGLRLHISSILSGLDKRNIFDALRVSHRRRTTTRCAYRRRAARAGYDPASEPGRAVLLSPHEYDRLRALNTEEFQRFCDRISERAAARGLTEDELAEILADEC